MLEVKQFPLDMSVFEVDRTDAKRCLLSGLFEEGVEVDGVIRRFYTYLKPGLCYNQPCLVVAPPEGVSVPEYLEDSFWVRFAHRHDLFLHILSPEGESWDLEGGDGDYMNKVYVQIQSRRSYVTMQDNIYAVGLGAGAAVAQQAVMKMSSEWSGLATFGDLAPQAMRNATLTHSGEDTGKTELSVNASKVPVPVWMAWTGGDGANGEVLDYWKKQNGVDPEPFSNRWADEVYFPGSVAKKSQLNEENISQVRVTNVFDGQLTEEFFQAVWGFLSQARRHRGFGHKMLRAPIEPEAYGVELHTLELDGFTRRWYEYVPDRVRNGGKPVPLVVCMHGRGGSAESFLSLSGMTRVAEERDFIVVFPEASVSQQRPGGLRNLLLWNGDHEGKDIDDVAFILRMVNDVKARRAVDASRVYACGQSSGGMMASKLAVCAPQVFAAVSPWSAIKSPEDTSPPPAQIDPAVPYLFLFGEHDWLCVDRENGQMEYHVAPDIAAFLKNLMKLYQLDERPRRYDCGEISYYVYMDPRRVPMLIVGTVRDMSHANYPRESWIAYDEFLCKFSKEADGTLRYMGEKV